jgi:hypothetical protein
MGQDNPDSQALKLVHDELMHAAQTMREELAKLPGKYAGLEIAISDLMMCYAQRATVMALQSVAPRMVAAKPKAEPPSWEHP